MPGRVYTIPPASPFAETLARGLIRQLGDAPLALADATIYLPTRRAQRTFGEAFARVLGGAALLPRFKALGDADDDELLFEIDALDLPPAIAPMRRTLLLAALVQRWRGDGTSFAHAFALAEGLGEVMDEVETYGADLKKLDDFVPVALAAHWEEVRRFLVLIEQEWTDVLAAEGRMGRAARRDLALRGLAERIVRTKHKGPVIAAGSTGSIPATAELMRAILSLDEGMIVLPGLDLNLDEESWWSLDPGHPQYGMQQLLERLKIGRKDVATWDGAASTSREMLLREVLRPPPTTDAWRSLAEEGAGASLRESLNGLSLIEAADPVEEAETIALALREALETPGRTAALVTPDRNLARRVAGELKRWDIDADDSAGRPLAQTEPGSLLCLLAEAADAGFAPVPLLALLKHPLCTAGEVRADFLKQVHGLDRALRGPRPDPGLAGIAKALATWRGRHEDHSVSSALQYWFASLRKILEPLERALAEDTVDLLTVVTVHRDVAEALAGENWRAREAGEVAEEFLIELRESADALPPIERGAYAALFRKLALAPAVRLQRSGHPRVAILGPLEARLQSFDTIVLGGLNEGSWPRVASADPWFSRPMREVIGLEQLERSIGQAAHDFAMLSAGKHVILTRAQKTEGAPAVASRWIQRLLQFAQGLGIADALAPAMDYPALAAALSEVGEVKPEGRPAPRPPLEARPTKASVTEIERWVRDPYAIYARRVLGLEVLDHLDEPIGPLERGNAFHKALERFVKEMPGPLPEDAALRLIAIADEVFAAEGTPKAALALWRPRFVHAANWFVAQERERRARIKASYTEVYGAFEVAEGFKLYGYADRIDLLTDGTAAIIDYKTGAPPTDKEIEVFLAPQLPLEAAILAAGGFDGLAPLSTSELLYIRVSGGREPGSLKPVDVAAIEQAVARLKERIALFRDPATPYLPRPHARFAREEGDYDHLARVREWLLGGWEDA